MGTINKYIKALTVAVSISHDELDNLDSVSDSDSQIWFINDFSLYFLTSQIKHDFV